MAEAYPLYWPEGWKRTSYRESSRFKTGFGAARNFLFAELTRMGASRVILSTNIPLRIDGLPRANMRPDGNDPGVAVYFQRKGKAMVFACDKYRDAAENIYAIGKKIEAMRGIERWGASDMMERAFSGFRQLSADTGGPSWWDTLGISREATEDAIQAAFRAKAKHAHPDAPSGSVEEFRKLTLAREQGLSVRRNQAFSGSAA